MPDLATLAHEPTELVDCMPSPCAARSCDHVIGGCPTSTVTACGACTFTGVDVGNADVITPVLWPCEHATGRG